MSTRRTPQNSGRDRMRALTATLAGALVATLGAAASVAAPVAQPQASGDGQREWQFRVLLDGDEIGYHRFELSQQDGLFRLRSEAEFKVRFLFFDAYSYRHVNEEIWRDDCLQRIDARTRVNGDAIEVRGERGEEGFVVATREQEQVLAECVMSFAYWNPEFLDQERLLNSQTGEYQPVSIQPVGEEQLRIRGEMVEAIRYSLDADKLDMDLWYTPDRQWLALESETKSGRMLRYELR